MAPNDDDIDASVSDPHRYESNRKLRALQRKLEQEGKKVEQPTLRQDKANLKLSILKNQLSEGQKDALTKQDRILQQEQSTGFGTKTREQEIAQAKLDASAKPAPDQLVQQGEATAKIQEEQQKEGEVQSEPA